MNLGWIGAISAFGFGGGGGTAVARTSINREAAGVYRTPHEKASRVKASKRNKAAKKARKRNRR